MSTPCPIPQCSWFREGDLPERTGPAATPVERDLLAHLIDYHDAPTVAVELITRVERIAHLEHALPQVPVSIAEAERPDEVAIKADPPPALALAVLFRSRTAAYTVPATITATQASLNPAGVRSGNVPELEYPDNVHLTVFTPGLPGLRANAQDFVAPSTAQRVVERDPDGDPVATAPVEVSENVAGCYQEWNVPHWRPVGPEHVRWQKGELALQPPGTWTWPPRR